MKLKRKHLRKLLEAAIAESERTDREAFYDSGEYEEQQEFQEEDEEPREYDYGDSERYLEGIPDQIEEFMKENPILADMRGIVENAFYNQEKDKVDFMAKNIVYILRNGPEDLLSAVKEYLEDPIF
jgi:hypothetical protein